MFHNSKAGLTVLLVFICLTVLILFLVFSTSLFSKNPKGVEPSQTGGIAVFVPGMLEGSPTYEQMDKGVRQFAETQGLSVTTIEGGFNQGEWKNQLASLASEAEYELVVTSNPALTEICQEVKQMFPTQRFLVLDGGNEKSEELIIFSYNHKEQGFLAGVLAAHLDQFYYGPAKDSARIGLVAGQSYPDMDRSIVPGYLAGMKSVNPLYELDYRVVGNWYDANKAAELADSIYNQGAHVILPIAGGANQGVVSSAQKTNNLVIWFDSPGTHLAPKTIYASILVQQERAAMEMVSAILNGEFEEGDIIRGNIQNGYVGVDSSEEGYIKNVPLEIRDEMDRITQQFIQGRYNLD